jgi:NAD(P)-dependent dehydrogenase (short-subunit alcohol dehydrogenase family)
METDFSGKTAVITGSTAGVGYKIAEFLALAGANVVISGRKTPAVDSAVEKLALAAPQVSVSGVVSDVGTAKGVDELLAKQPRADILINNVGIYDSEDFFDISDEKWMHYFEVIVMSGIRLSRAYLPGMIQRYWGRVIFISSEWALNIPSHMIPYGVTKSAVLSLTQGLANRVQATGVTVNAILLGPIQSVQGMAGGQKELCLTMEETVALYENDHHLSTLAFPRAATTEEIANTVLYLSSAQAQGSSGTLIHLDGNAHLTSPMASLTPH